jgi:hypothetical protein
MAITNASFVIILPSTLVPPISFVHLKLTISCFTCQYHVAIRVQYMPKSKDVHCYWAVARQRVPATPLAPTRCHCSRIRSIQLRNSRSYYADFSISEEIPEGSATGRFSTNITRSNFCYFHNRNVEISFTSWISHVQMSGALSSKLSLVLQLTWYTRCKFPWEDNNRSVCPLYNPKVTTHRYPEALVHSGSTPMMEDHPLSADPDISLVTRRGSPTGFWNAETPTYSPDNRFTDGGEFVSLMRRSLLTPRKIPGRSCRFLTSATTMAQMCKLGCVIRWFTRDMLVDSSCFPLCGVLSRNTKILLIYNSHNLLELVNLRVYLFSIQLSK